jgi:uncharacterized protein (DUF924 family)
MEDLQKIHDYWFGEEPNDLAVITRQSSLWFGKDEQVDLYIKDQFEPMIKVVERSKALPVQQSLAQIILLDQFTRNIYRGQAEMFAFDSIALQMVLEGLALGDDRQLRPVERVFYYLPLEHSENLESQSRSVELYQALIDEVPDEWQPAFDGFLDYAIRHQVVIARFGRFPHRNATLGRISTAEECEFLKQPGSSF